MTYAYPSAWGCTRANIQRWCVPVATIAAVVVGSGRHRRVGAQA